MVTDRRLRCECNRCTCITSLRRRREETKSVSKEGRENCRETRIRRRGSKDREGEFNGVRKRERTIRGIGAQFTTGTHVPVPPITSTQLSLPFSVLEESEAKASGKRICKRERQQTSLGVEHRADQHHARHRYWVCEASVHSPTVKCLAQYKPSCYKLELSPDVRTSYL